MLSFGLQAWLARHELLGVHGIYGEEAKKYQGRATGPVWQERPCTVVLGLGKRGTTQSAMLEGGWPGPQVSY